MKTLGNLLIALGIVAIGLPTLFSWIAKDEPFAWLLGLLNLNIPLAIACAGGSLVLILVGIIVRNVKDKEKKQ